jgi:tRNA-(ms[2]io[6]A)-hydroxylase
MTVPAPIRNFLTATTPAAWVDAAAERVPELLIDHANCELKAASTALGLIYRYPERAALADRMSRLAREELRHFEQVRKIMRELGVPFERLSASRYAGRLRDQVRDSEPARLLDVLLIGAIIEARSCERFAAVAGRLPDELGRFYLGLLSSEARHFEHYLHFAKTETGFDDDTVEARLSELLAIDAALVTEPDDEFRFHSGTPAELAQQSPKSVARN